MRHYGDQVAEKPLDHKVLHTKFRIMVDVYYSGLRTLSQAPLIEAEKSSMAYVHLNATQENELVELVEFEREKQNIHSLYGGKTMSCIFPFKPYDSTQASLIEAGMLEVITHPGHEKSGSYAVVISADGYAYVDELKERDAYLRKARKHDYLLILFASAFAMLCTVIGFLLGRNY